MCVMWCELIVVGSDSAGMQAALTAARAGVRTVVILPPSDARPTATQYLAAMEELIDRLSSQGPATRRPTVSACREIVRRILVRERQLTERLLERAGVSTLVGEWRWRAADRLDVATDGGWQPVEGEKVIVAVGDDFAVPKWAANRFGGKANENVMAIDTVLERAEWPTHAVVVGADQSGTMMARLLMAVGVEVTMVERRARVAVPGATVLSPTWGTGLRTDRAGDAAVVTHDGRLVAGDVVVLATGRQGRAAGRNFAKLGAKLDAKGRLWCGSNHETVVCGLYATGAAVAEPTATNGFDAAVAILKDAFPERAAIAATRRGPRLPAGWGVVG